MKVLELFAGTRSIGKAFEKHGHEVYSIEWNKDFDNIDWYEDIGKITAQDIIDRFGHPDVIWASPDCTSYSLAAISHHRVKNKETGKYEGRDTAVSVKQQQDEEANKVAQQILNAPQATPQSDVHIVAPVSNVVNQSQMVQPTVTTDATVDDDSDPLPF